MNVPRLGDPIDAIAFVDILDGAEDDLDVVVLPRKDVAGQYPLSPLAPATLRHADIKNEKPQSRSELSPNIAPGESEVSTRAPGANAAQENPIAGTGNDGGVAARMYVEYVSHVLRVGLGGVTASTEAVL
ncbi:MAG: hypothetical protein V2A73_04490 [Pseudomonadota bacterium]